MLVVRNQQADHVSGEWDVFASMLRSAYVFPCYALHS